MNIKIHLSLLAIAIVAISETSGASGHRPGCTCICPFSGLNVCETVNRMKTEVDINTAQFMIWAEDLNFLQHFKQNWREKISDIVEATIENYIAKGILHGKPKTLSGTIEHGMLNDAAMFVKPSEDDSDLAKNVSSLLEKVEMVENRTKEVENELKTERRVRRDLEEKVNKTHTSLVFIEDQLQNVSAPMDAMVTEVEMKLHASIEDLNKTIYEDHLKKLYYQVEGVVYKNETQKLDERLESIEGELHDGSNASIVSKFAEELKSLEENLHLLNRSIGDVVVPRLQTLNGSIGDVLLPRLETLEVDAVRKDAAAALEDKMANLLNDTEMLKTALDQLQNVSAPTGVMVSEVEMKLHASIEDLNRTIYEDHLKKLYYQVEGVAYKNETQKLDERLESIEGELHDGGNASIVSRFAEELKSLEENLHLLNRSIGDVVVPRLQTLNGSIGDVLLPRLETLEEDAVRKDAAAALEDKMADLLSDTEMFKIALVDVLTSVKDVQSLEKKFQNFSEHLTVSLETMQKEIEFLKYEALAKPVIGDSDGVIKTDRLVQLNSTDDDTYDTAEFEIYTTMAPEESNLIQKNTNDVGVGYFESNDVLEYQATTEESTEEFDFITLEQRSRMGKDLENNSTNCDVPLIDDPHLLVDVVQNEEGRQTLKFGCKPIGRYIVPPVPVPPRCENGTWRNPVPSCRELSSENTIESLAEELLMEHPCKSGSGEFPDPTNCTQFFKCAHGRLTVIPCPHGLRFNAVLKVCDYPRTTGCYADSSKPVEQLQTLIPPIRIEPDNLDRSNSLLGTGKTGELVVHPRSSFTLHCLYPDSIYGDPAWNVSYLHPGVTARILTPKKGNNRVSITVTAAKEEDSGIYRCLTPFGLKHGVEVTVKAVICPALPVEDVFYRPTPEGELRILGTTAEIPCEDGHKVTLHCMANGAWSRELPSKEECTPKKRSDDKMWNCPPLDFSEHPDLITEMKDDEKKVTFKCAGRMRLVGRTFARCLDEGFWSHTSLPFCKK